MAPEYGVGIRRFLFEQYPDYRIDERIREQVRRYLPQVSIISLNISRDDARMQAKTGQSNSLSVELIYEIKVVGDVWLRVSAKEFNAWSGLKRILSENDLSESNGKG